MLASSYILLPLSPPPSLFSLPLAPRCGATLTTTSPSATLVVRGVMGCWSIILYVFCLDNIFSGYSITFCYCSFLTSPSLPFFISLIPPLFSLP